MRTGHDHRDVLPHGGALGPASSVSLVQRLLTRVHLARWSAVAGVVWALGLATPVTAHASGGQLDPTFGSGGIVTTSFGGSHDQAYDVVQQPDGKIVAAGETGAFGVVVVAPGFDLILQTTGPAALARYNPDGSLDTGFGRGGLVTTTFQGNDAIRGLALQPDGKIVAAGRAGIALTSSTFGVARYNPDGSLDSTFGSGGVVTTAFPGNAAGARAVSVLGSGKILVAGIAPDPADSSQADFTVVRYNPDGTLDPGFGSGGIAYANFGDGTAAHAFAMAIQPADGKIVLAGFHNVVDMGLMRLTPNGRLDATFGTGGRVITTFASGASEAFGVAVQPGDGKIVAAGFAGGTAIPFPPTGPQEGGFALARYTPDGRLDRGFGTGGMVTTELGGPDDAARSVAVQADGSIVAAGHGGGTFAIARYKPNGQLDPKFGQGGTVHTVFGSGTSEAFGNSEAFAVRALSNGTLIAAGSATDASGNIDFGVARYQQ